MILFDDEEPCNDGGKYDQYGCGLKLVSLCCVRWLQVPHELKNLSPFLFKKRYKNYLLDTYQS